MSIVLVLVLLLGLSYAFFTLTLTGTKQNVIKVGKLSLNLAEGNAITLENAVPTSIEDGLTGTPYTFTVTNDGTVSSNYAIYLDNQDTTNTSISSFYYALKKDGKIAYLNTMDTNKLNSPMISGIMNPGEKSIYELYLWVDYNTTASSTSNLHFEGKIRVEANQQREQRLSTLVMHTCDGVANCTRQDGNITYFQDGYHFQNPAKYIWYSGKLWIVMSYDNEGNTKMMTLEPITAIPWGLSSNYQGSYVERWINEEFLPGLNNYENLVVTDQVWNYSETTGLNIFTSMGNDKLITSPVGLLNSHDVLMSSDGSNTVSGTQNIFKYPSQYLGNANSEGKIFLGGLAVPGLVSTPLPSSDDFYGISPAVVLKNNVLVIGGNGTKSNPYRLKGDTKGASGDLLNTRYMGEYVAFGDQVNTTYRITKIENGKTMVTSISPIMNIRLSAEEEDVYFLPQSKYRYTTGTNLNQWLADDTTYPLAYFLNHDFLNPLNGYLTSDDVVMISTNERWYPGSIRGGESYTKIRDSLVWSTATVGIPALGEMQMSQYDSNDSNNSMWGISHDHLLLNNNGTALYNGVDSGTLSAGKTRASVYLKSTVKIKSGSGTKYDPYILTLS